MSNSSDTYSANLALLKSDFPNKKLLNVAEVAKWSGKNRKTIKAHYFNDGKTYISLAELARRIS